MTPQAYFGDVSPTTWAVAPPNLPKATMSQHYAKLRAAGVVRATRKGVSVMHTLRCEDINAKFPGVLPAILDAVEV
jgi:DNA-binding transcriptional ArsR family regulator